MLPTHLQRGHVTDACTTPRQTHSYGPDTTLFRDTSNRTLWTPWTRTREDVSTLLTPQNLKRNHKISKSETKSQNLKQNHKISNKISNVVRGLLNGEEVVKLWCGWGLLNKEKKKKKERRGRKNRPFREVSNLPCVLLRFIIIHWPMFPFSLCIGTVSYFFGIKCIPAIHCRSQRNVHMLFVL